MQAHILYPAIAFLVSFVFQAAYSKYIIEPNCPDKEPRPWLDHFILSLPIAITIAGIVYFFTSQWAPKRKNNLGANGNVAGNNLRGNNMGRMNGNAYGRNNGAAGAGNMGGPVQPSGPPGAVM